MKKLKKTLSANASWVVLVALLIFFSMLSPNFMTAKNMITVLKQVSVNGICAVGLAIIMIGGGIDLSTGSQAAVAGMFYSAREQGVGNHSGFPCGNCYYGLYGRSAEWPGCGLYGHATSDRYPRHAKHCPWFCVSGYQWFHRL